MIRPLLWLPLAALSLAPALAQEEQTLKERVLALQALAGGEYCEDPSEFVDEDSYTEWTFSYRPSWSDKDEDKEEVTVVRVFCGTGAYNMQHTYYIDRDWEGLTPLAFATPTYDIKYADPDDTNSALESVTLNGMSAQTIMTNSAFDPETLTVTDASLWRGVGDASSSGIWVFKDGDFTLQHYEVDASYDGEMNPEVLLDYTEADKSK